MLNDFASFLVLWILFPTFPFSRLFYYSLGLFIIHYQPLMHVFDHALVIIIATISCFYLYNLPFFTLLTCHFPLSRAKDFFKTYIMHTLSSSKIIIPFVLYLWLCCYLLCFHILSLSLLKRNNRMMPLAPARISPYYASSCILTRRERQFLLISLFCLFSQINLLVVVSRSTNTCIYTSLFHFLILLHC